nr:mediator of RNA polymerase II transcription subunit 27 [Ipomoea batatas]
MQQATVNAALPTVSSPPPPPESNSSTTDAPPKQVAMALERLGQAGRLIADIRLGADRLLEALFVAAHPQHSAKPANLILKEEASMRQHLQDLRTIGSFEARLRVRRKGKCDLHATTTSQLRRAMANYQVIKYNICVVLLGRQLEDSGVLTDALRSRSNSWGLHMPLVCPDGAVVAYAWKRQLAGQAGASAVDRTRLALKAFTDQKRRFFPHLDTCEEGSPMKKVCNPVVSDQDDISGLRTVSDILTHLDKVIPNMKAFTYQRLDWLKRASSLPSSVNQNSVESLKDHNFHIRNNLRSGSNDNAAREKITVIELLIPSVFRAILSVHPAGSVYPDAVAFFSPDEEHAGIALQHFTGVNAETALCSLLLWIYSYQSLFTKVCSKCGRLLLMDKQSALLLPPVNRSYRNFSAAKILSKTSSTEDKNGDSNRAFHISCFSEET